MFCWAKSWRNHHLETSDSNIIPNCMKCTACFWIHRLFLNLQLVVSIGVHLYLKVLLVRPSSLSATLKCFRAEFRRFSCLLGYILLPIFRSLNKDIEPHTWAHDPRKIGLTSMPSKSRWIYPSLCRKMGMMTSWSPVHIEHYQAIMENLRRSLHIFGTIEGVLAQMTGDRINMIHNGTMRIYTFIYIYIYA